MIVYVRTICKARGRIFAPGRHDVDDATAKALGDAGFLVRHDAVETAVNPGMYEKAARRIGKR